MSNPIVSVIVCTYNRAGLLTKCLDNLVAQTLDPTLFEIIVVNNNSIDDTPQAADAFNSKFRNFRCVFEKNQGLSYARNRGIDEAHGEYVVYLDDDALAPPEYLSNLVNVIKTHRPDFVGGPVYPYYISEKPAWFRDSYETRKHENSSRFSSTCRVSGGNYTVKSEVFHSVGRFNVDLGMKGDQIGLGEDAAFLDKYRQITRASDQKVYYSLDCWVDHLVPKEKMTFGYYFKRKYLAGRMQNNVANLKNPSYFRTLLVGPRGVASTILLFARQVKRNGPIRADYILVIGSLIRAYGRSVEAVSYVWSRQRKRHMK